MRKELLESNVATTCLTFLVNCNIEWCDQKQLNASNDNAT